MRVIESDIYRERGYNVRERVGGTEREREREREREKDTYIYIRI